MGTLTTTPLWSLPKRAISSGLRLSPHWTSNYGRIASEELSSSLAIAFPISTSVIFFISFIVCGQNQPFLRRGQSRLCFCPDQILFRKQFCSSAEYFRSCLKLMTRQQGWETSLSDWSETHSELLLEGQIERLIS